MGYYSYSEYLTVASSIQEKFPYAVVFAGNLGFSFKGSDIQAIEIGLPGEIYS